MKNEGALTPSPLGPINTMPAVYLSWMIKKLQNMLEEEGDMPVAVVVTKDGGPDEHMKIYMSSNPAMLEADDFGGRGGPLAVIVGVEKYMIESNGEIESTMSED